jgi:tetratricopeptide (TPR) repeat protein
MTEQRSRVYEAQLRLAAHYVDVVCKACEDYLRGFEGSVNAVTLFNEERVQIEKSAAWLLRSMDNPEVARLFVKLVRDGYQLLYACLPNDELDVWLEQSLMAAEKLGDVGAQAKHLYALGWSLHRKGNVQGGVPFFEKAYVLAESVGELRLMSSILNIQGELATRRGEREAAANYHERAYAIRRELRDALGIQHYLYEKGSGLFEGGHWDEALKYFQQAYDQALNAGGYREIARVLTSIGIIYKSQGQFTNAIAVYEQALEFSQRIQFPPVIVYTLHALAETYVALNKLDAAQTYYMQALHIAQQAKLAARVADIQAELGILAYWHGELDEAMCYIDTALKVHRACQADYNIGVDLSYLTLVYAAQGDYTAARHAVLESLQVIVPLNSDTFLVLPIFTAVHQGILQALSRSLPSSEQTMLLQAAVRWAGTVMAHPGIDQLKRNTFASLRPSMEAVLGVQRITELLHEGAERDLMMVVTEIEAALQS